MVQVGFTRAVQSRFYLDQRGDNFVSLNIRNQQEAAFSKSLIDHRQTGSTWMSASYRMGGKKKKWGVDNPWNRLCSLLPDMAVRQRGSILQKSRWC